MRRCLTLFSTAIVPLAIFMACGGDGAGSDEGPSQVAEQCEQESCPACTGADALLMIGTSDHPQHTIDAKAAKAAADKNGYWFNDANDLTDTTEAGKALNALSHMPEGKIRTLVIAVHGHGIQGALAFNDGSTLSYPDLFDAIAKVGACKVYISNDSCYSGSMFEAMPDAGLGTCETVAASASGPDTGSSCTNGLSKVFTENLNAGTEPKAALEAAAASAGVQGNASPGMIETIVNPDCACGTTCIPRSALGKGADQLPGSGGSGGQSGAGGASGDSGVAGSAGSGGSGGIGTAGTGGTGTAGAAGSSGGGNGGSAGDAGASMCAAHADPCVDCVRTQCCSAVEACAADSSCKAALATWESCTMDAYSCAELFGVAGGSLANDVVSCSFQSCSAACYP